MVDAWVVHLVMNMVECLANLTVVMLVVDGHVGWLNTWLR